ncbi:hypothetical protein [Allomuricauda sp. d1]|uniref:hypothetical protein n=1 Tax=Allomuricauda sp. d1 TaxID=3136725 RepID=UPI0031CE8639
MVNDELLAIDWNDVDQYPLFETCDESAAKDQQLTCFQEQMYTNMVTTLEGLQYTVPQELNDTVNIDLLIDEHGFITVIDVHDSGVVDELIPEFSQEVTQRLNDVTTVAPALKRGIPVSMKFRLPIILNTAN